MLKLEMAKIIHGSLQNSVGRAHLPNCCFCFGDKANFPSLSLKTKVTPKKVEMAAVTKRNSILLKKYTFDINILQHLQRKGFNKFLTSSHPQQKGSNLLTYVKTSRHPNFSFLSTLIKGTYSLPLIRDVCLKMWLKRNKRYVSEALYRFAIS